MPSKTGVMKKYFISVFLFGLMVQLFAGENQIESKISNVTVFIHGAQIYRSAETLLPAGTSEVIFSELPTSLLGSSLQVEAPETVTILSVNFKINKKEEGLNESELSEIDSEIEKKEFEIKKLKQQLTVYTNEENILLKNSSFSGSELGVNLTELKLAADYFRSRLNEIAMKKLELENQILLIQKKLNSDKNDKIALQQIRPEPTGEVIVKVEAKSNGKFKLKLSYFIPSAGWIPVYDVRVNDISKPILLSVKANVFQSTGEDWSDVKLTLSTDNPHKSNIKPTLEPWYLRYGQPYRPTASSYKHGVSTIKGRIRDANTHEPIPFANVVLEQSGRIISGATTDFDGNYNISNANPGYYDLKASYVGYSSSLIKGVALNPDQITFYDVMMSSSNVTLEEVVVSSFKAPLIDKDNTISGGSVMPERNTNSIATQVGGVYQEDSKRYGIDDEIFFIEGTKVSNSEEYIPQQMIQTPTNINYEIEVPYSIPSDGEHYVVRIVDHQIPTLYEHYCAPKLTEDVFLIARLIDWSDLNLLSGESSIYFEGTYMGKSFLETRSTGDTLPLSIGQDNNVVVVREQIKEYKSSQIIGSSIKETRGYKISVRNNRNIAVSLIVEDQVPMSTIKGISVELDEAPDSELDEKTGLLTWKLKLLKNENKELSLKYSVKYPKGSNLYID